MTTDRYTRPIQIVLLVVVSACGKATLVESSKPPPGQPDAAAARPPPTPTPAAAPGKSEARLYGSYLFETETGGTGPAKGAEVVLKFIPPDRVTLRAARPGEILTDVGSFTTDHDRITLELPGIEKRVKGAAFTFDGVRLVLPFRIIGDGEGASHWRRMGSDAEPDPLSRAIERYYTHVAERGRTACLEELARELPRSPTVSAATIHGGATLLVTYRSGYREAFLAPPLSTTPSPPPEGVPDTAAPRDLDLPITGDRSTPVRMLHAAYARIETGSRGGLLQAQSAPVAAGIPGRPGRFDFNSRFEAWLEPEPAPVSQGDAPKVKTALIVAPYQSLPVLIPGPSRDRYVAFGEFGEDPSEVARVLQVAGYKVEGPLLDAQVTVKRLHGLLKDRAWGVLYFSTHGGDLGGAALLSTGEQIPATYSASPEAREKYLRDSVTRDLGKDGWDKLKGSLLVGYINDDVPFICITNSFFREVNADFTSGLTYMSGCDTAQSPYLRDSLRARSFVGWKGETHMELTSDMSKAFWRCLGRKTRSDREAMDWGINYLLGAKGYKDKMSIYGPTYDPNNLVVYRAGRAEPEKRLTDVQHLMLYTSRAYAVRKRAAGKSEDLAAIAAQLHVCNDEDKGTGLAATPFCREALNGVKSDPSVIDEVKGELCGYGRTRSRFALEEN